MWLWQRANWINHRARAKPHIALARNAKNVIIYEHQKGLFVGKVALSKAALVV